MFDTYNHNHYHCNCHCKGQCNCYNHNCQSNSLRKRKKEKRYMTEWWQEKTIAQKNLKWEKIESYSYYLYLLVMFPTFHPYLQDVKVGDFTILPMILLLLLGIVYYIQILIQKKWDQYHHLKGGADKTVTITVTNGIPDPQPHKNYIKVDSKKSN